MARPANADGAMDPRWLRRDGSACFAESPTREGAATVMNLTRQEASLIGQSHADALQRMNEKQLKDLQSRLRTARQGAARVEAEGARRAAQPANERRGEKVAVFDEALADFRQPERLDAVRQVRSRTGAGVLRAVTDPYSATSVTAEWPVKSSVRTKAEYRSENVR